MRRDMPSGRAAAERIFAAAGSAPISPGRPSFRLHAVNVVMRSSAKMTGSMQAVRAATAPLRPLSISADDLHK